MVKLNRINENRINHKGQSLVEAAIFGSLLLTLLAVLLDYGLRYNYKQEAKMEAFRRALKMAGESELAKTQDIVLIKDLHIPAPSDRFALGERTTIRESNNVFWSNNTQALFSTPELTPTVNYTFNPGNDFAFGYFPDFIPVTRNITRTYTTAALDNQTGSIVSSNDLILKGEPEVMLGGRDSRVYQPEEGAPKEVMILMNNTGDCENIYCAKTILDEVKFTGTLVPDDRFRPVFNVAGNVGSVPTNIGFLDDAAGQINATLGKMQVENKVIRKHRNLTLTETPTQYQSQETLYDDETINHVIMIRNTGTSYTDDGPTIVFENKNVPTWTTPK